MTPAKHTRTLRQMRRLCGSRRPAVQSVSRSSNPNGDAAARHGPNPRPHAVPRSPGFAPCAAARQPGCDRHPPGPSRRNRQPRHRRISAAPRRSIDPWSGHAISPVHPSNGVNHQGCRPNLPLLRSRSYSGPEVRRSAPKSCSIERFSRTSPRGCNHGIRGLEWRDRAPDEIFCSDPQR